MNLLATIVNYDKDDKARMIANSLPCASVIIDSSGRYKRGFIATDHPFGSGCYNKAMEIFLRGNYDYCLYICSDVTGDWKNVVETILRLPGNIGTYSPAITGAGWKHEKSVNSSGLRDVPFNEGNIVLFKRELVEKYRYCDPFNDIHAYSVDPYLAFTAHKMWFRTVVDDSISVYHPDGKAYSNKTGVRQLRDFIKTKDVAFKEFCNDCGIGIPFYARWWRKLLTITKVKKYYSYK